MTERGLEWVLIPAILVLALLLVRNWPQLDIDAWWEAPD